MKIEWVMAACPRDESMAAVLVLSDMVFASLLVFCLVLNCVMNHNMITKCLET